MAPSKKDTFFPGVRKGLRLEAITPLANAAGEKRLKLDVSMSLADGKLVGIPEWLTGAVRIVQEVAMGQKKTVSEVELDGITLQGFMGETNDVVIDLVGVLAKGFIVQRSSTEKASGEVADVELYFTMYTHWNVELWKRAWEWFNNTMQCSFTSRQAKLTFGPAKKEKAEDMSDDDKMESDRKAATSKSQDHLFAATPDAKTRAAGDKPDADPPPSTAKPLTMPAPRGFTPRRPN